MQQDDSPYCSTKNEECCWCDGDSVVRPQHSSAQTSLNISERKTKNLSTLIVKEPDLNRDDQTQPVLYLLKKLCPEQRYHQTIPLVWKTKCLYHGLLMPIPGPDPMPIANGMGTRNKGFVGGRLIAVK